MTVDVVNMLARWTSGEPVAGERRTDVVDLLNEVVHLQAGRDEDTARLAQLEAEAARLRGQLAAHVAMHDITVKELNTTRRQLQQVRAERDDACVELVRERGDAVALLWACASAANAESRTTAMNLASVATRIERGEHRREEGA
jgi:hypothetical protein